MSKIYKDFIKNYDEDGDIGYFLEVDIEYPRELHDLQSDLPFLPKKLKLISATSLCAICIIKKYVVHIRALKQALKYGVKLKKVYKASMAKSMSRSMAKRIY